MLSFTIGRSTISLFMDGQFYSLDDSHVNYEVILAELKKPVSERDIETLRTYISVRRVIEVLSAGRVTVLEDDILYDGEAVNNYMTQRMLDLMLDGFDIEPWAHFMNNVFDNPAEYARGELYEWMEKAEMPMTEDGHFLAFKKVRADYTDCHTGKFDHSPGSIVEMPREKCDPVRTNHCSTGFHFCSVDYLSSFGGQRVVIVKINPRDVTSIPDDYSFTKGRCCRYEVVAELTKQSAAHDKCWRKGVVNLENPAEFPDDVLACVKMPTPVLNEPVVEDGAARIEEDMTDADKADDTQSIGDLTLNEVEDICRSYKHKPEVRLRLLRDRLEARGGGDPTPAIFKLDKANSQIVEDSRRHVLHLGESRAFAIYEEIKAEEEKAAAEKAAKAESSGSTISIVSEAVASMTPDTASVYPASLTFTTNDGREFTGKQIIDALEDAQAIRAAARELGIGESTLRGWKKKIEAAGGIEE